MVNGDRVHHCTYCYKKEDGGEESPRTLANQIAFKGDTDAFKQFISYTTAKGYDADPIESLDLRFGNLCNLRCKMCSPHSSSMIERDYRKLRDADSDEYDRLIGMNFPTQVGWEEDSRGWEQICKCIPHLKKLSFTGGEPTLIESNLRFLEQCATSGHASNMYAKFTTNMTNINQSLIDTISCFGSVKIDMSIDGVGAVQEYIRYPSNWNKTKQNVARVMDLDMSMRLSQVLTVQILNVLQLPEVFDEMIALHQASQYRHPFTIHANLVDAPSMLNISNAPDVVKTVAKQRLQDWIASNSDQCKFLDMKSIENVLIRLDSESNPTITRTIIPYMNFQDKTRKVSLHESCPELHRLLQIS